MLREFPRLRAAGSRAALALAIVGFGSPLGAAAEVKPGDIITKHNQDKSWFSIAALISAGH